MKAVRRIMIISMLSIVTIICCGTISYADSSGNCGYYGQNVTWKYSSSTKTLTFSGSGLMTEDWARNPSSLPWRNYEVEKVVVNSGVTSVGSWFFYGFDSLKSVSLANSVLIIGDQAFALCDNLSSVSLSSKLLGIGCQAFEDCAITNITLPSTVQYIDGSAFEGSNLKSVTLNQGLLEIGDYAFASCSNLTSIKIPSTVKYIGYEPFSKCGKLTSIHLYCGVPQGEYSSFSQYQKTIYYYDTTWTLNNRISWGKYATWTFSHEWDKDFTIDIEPTCAEKGLKTRHCKYCNEKTDYTTIDPTGEHDLYPDKVTVKPTCKEKGEQLLKCSNCDYQTTKELPINPDNHVFDDGITITEATCMNDGLKECTCQLCGLKQNKKVSAKGHIYNKSYTVDKKATITSYGLKSKHCSRCDATTETVINKASGLKASATVYTYNGRVRKPTITIKDSKGKTIPASNYTLTNKGGKNVGTYTAKVVFKGDYKGTWTATYMINPKGATIIAPTSLSKGLIAKWKKQSAKMATSRITGYQIRYSLKSSMASAKTVKVKGYIKTSKKITKLKPKKKYYVQVRTYKTVCGKTYYSPWSAKKAVITRK